MQRSGDATYRVAQRIVVAGPDVLDLVELVTAVADALKRTAPPP